MTKPEFFDWLTTHMKYARRCNPTDVTGVLNQVAFDFCVLLDRRPELRKIGGTLHEEVHLHSLAQPGAEVK